MASGHRSDKMKAMGVTALARNLGLGSLLADLTRKFGGYELLDHWQRGEFHHDLLLRVEPNGQLPGPVLVVATNCNGGVKEVLSFATPPREEALWHHRCPDVKEFGDASITILARAITPHWFDPCELLRADARSELKPEHRERDEGGGWKCKTR